MSQKQNEISHVVDQGEKILEDSPEMKKLRFLQEKVLEIEEKLEKIEQNTRKVGGSQPSSKFTTRELFTERSGQRVLSELGKDIMDWFDMDENDELDKNDFKRIMSTHGWTAGSTDTWLNWMEKVAGHYDRLEYKVGERGGTNKPSRIVAKDEW